MADDWDPLAEAVVIAYCGWNPLRQVVDATVRRWGDGSNLLALPCMNVTDVSQITTPDVYNLTAPAVVLDPSQYQFRPDGVILATYGPVVATGQCYNLGGWWDGQPYDVTYSGGYANPPDDLVAVLKSLTNRAGRFDLQSSRLGSAAFTFSAGSAGGGLLLVEQMVLDRYRIVKIA